MTELQIAGSIIMIILSVAIIAIVLVQKDKQANLSGAISGGDSSGNFFDKTKGKHKEAVLEKGTRILAIIFFIIAIATTAVILFA
ncbi:MAG: preprotein translocase subunit SecG [Clostridia bacterium]|nr:preprotein translocase subunit SecG [Clostridia bacterium]